MRAFKKLEIYKVPNILIFHLKRFKDSKKYFQSKLNTQVNFPIQEFNVSPFCINKFLISQFDNEVNGTASILTLTKCNPTNWLTTFTQ